MSKAWNLCFGVGGRGLAYLLNKGRDGVGKDLSTVLFVSVCSIAHFLPPLLVSFLIGIRLGSVSGTSGNPPKLTKLLNLSSAVVTSPS